MQLFQKSHRSFAVDEYLHGDSGYTLTSRMLTPYRQLLASIPDNTYFNERISSARVIIEHVKGILKNRWACLHGLRVQIRQKEDFKIATNWLEVTCILHNIMQYLNDDWHNDKAKNLVTDDANTGSEAQETTGNELRARIQAILLSQRDE